jgi:selenocysteine-specific elongation factor
MRTVTLGTAGHIDHGKTALVHALTGIDPDRLPEEKRRGITIDLGFAHLDLDGATRLAIIDVPGHEAFIRNMAAGASGIDLGLLVIAADEGVRPQTREHVAILELLNVRPAAIALTKADRVDEDWLLLVQDDTRTQLARTSFAHAPIVVVSARTGQGLEDLKQKLGHAAHEVAARTALDFFRLPIDRVFTVRGTGTVVTGTVWSGTLGKDQLATLIPSGLPARVRGLQRQGSATDAVCAGERAAIALAGVPVNAISRGETLVTEADWTCAHRATALVRVLDAAANPLRDRQRVHIHLGTATTLARLRPLESEIEPGAWGWVTLQFQAPLAVRTGDRFVLRSFSPVTTIGGGEILEWAARPYRRRVADLPQLSRLASSELQHRAEGALTLAGWRGLDAKLLPLHVVGATARALDLTPVAGRVYHGPLFVHIADHLLGRMGELHERHPLRPAIDLESLRQSAPPAAPPALVAHVIANLIRAGTVRSVEGGVALPGWAPRLSTQQSALIEAVFGRLQRAGLTSPTVSELAAELGSDVYEVIRLLAGQGHLTQVALDLFLPASAVEAARRTVARALVGGPQAPAALKAALGLSRKHLIPLLEYFDRVGLTRRVGDLRTLESVEAVSHHGGATP